MKLIYCKFIDINVKFQLKVQKANALPVNCKKNVIKAHRFESHAMHCKFLN